LEAGGTIIFGNMVIVDQGAVVRPSQLIASVRRLRGEGRRRSWTMNSRLCVWGLVFCGAAACAAAQTATPLPQEIEACRLNLTSQGSHARFADSAVFSLEASGTGGHANVTTVRAPHSNSAFLDLAKVRDCLSRWALRPGTAFTVVLHFGTTDELLRRWVISVSDQGQELTRILLPRDLEQE
jgi:hypothetical protein